MSSSSSEYCPPAQRYHKQNDYGTKKQGGATNTHLNNDQFYPNSCKDGFTFGYDTMTEVERALNETKGTNGHQQATRWSYADNFTDIPDGPSDEIDDLPAAPQNPPVAVKGTSPGSVPSVHQLSFDVMTGTAQVYRRVLIPDGREGSGKVVMVPAREKTPVAPIATRGKGAGNEMVGDLTMPFEPDLVSGDSWDNPFHIQQVVQATECAMGTKAGKTNSLDFDRSHNKIYEEGFGSRDVVFDQVVPSSASKSFSFSIKDPPLHTAALKVLPSPNHDDEVQSEHTSVVQDAPYEMEQKKYFERNDALSFSGSEIDRPTHTNHLRLADMLRGSGGIDMGLLDGIPVKTRNQKQAAPAQCHDQVDGFPRKTRMETQKAAAQFTPCPLSLPHQPVAHFNPAPELSVVAVNLPQPEDEEDTISPLSISTAGSLRQGKQRDVNETSAYSRGHASNQEDSRKGEDYGPARGRHRLHTLESHSGVPSQTMSPANPLEEVQVQIEKLRLGVQRMDTGKHAKDAMSKDDIMQQLNMLTEALHGSGEGPAMVFRLPGQRGGYGAQSINSRSKAERGKQNTVTGTSITPSTMQEKTTIFAPKHYDTQHSSHGRNWDNRMVSSTNIQHNGHDRDWDNDMATSMEFSMAQTPTSDHKEQEASFSNDKTPMIKNKGKKYLTPSKPPELNIQVPNSYPSSPTNVTQTSGRRHSHSTALHPSSFYTNHQVQTPRSVSHSMFSPVPGNEDMMDLFTDAQQGAIFLAAVEQKLATSRCLYQWKAAVGILQKEERMEDLSPISKVSSKHDRHSMDIAPPYSPSPKGGQIFSPVHSTCSRSSSAHTSSSGRKRHGWCRRDEDVRGVMGSEEHKGLKQSPATPVAREGPPLPSSDEMASILRRWDDRSAITADAGSLATARPLIVNTPTDENTAPNNDSAGGHLSNVDHTNTVLQIKIGVDTPHSSSSGKKEKKVYALDMPTSIASGTSQKPRTPSRATARAMESIALRRSRSRGERR
uniref:Uncharacterized protein n=1 Tax=Corethron hystrix TaxID=216773 RepID=A0A7S1FX27_9STRA